LYGGNMNNPVVRALETGLQRAGRTTLRFNFRGAGGSTGAFAGGSGEADDLRAAVGHLIKTAGVKEVAVAGYSFGAMVTLRAAPALAEVDRFIAVAPPLSFFDLGELATCSKPKLFIAGDRDQYCSVTDVNRQLAVVGDPKQLRILAGADHFLYGDEPEIAAAAADFAAR
jgi:alpha/beta superfamily hydrolase